MLHVFTLCAVIVGVSIFFIYSALWIGLIFIALGLVCLASLLPFKIKLKSIQPDIIFGLINNGFLAIFAIAGGHFAGVTGAIFGGLAGNAVTDGIAGLFEGHSAEKLRLQRISEERTMLKSAVGKMAGCLLGAGAVLVFASLLI